MLTNEPINFQVILTGIKKTCLQEVLKVSDSQAVFEWVSDRELEDTPEIAR